jgi:conjugative relaxase-like TrwC/TraI family protein
VVNERKTYDQAIDILVEKLGEGVIREYQAKVDQEYQERLDDYLNVWGQRQAVPKDEYEQVVDALIAAREAKEHIWSGLQDQVTDTLLEAIRRVCSPDFLENFGIRIRHDITPDLAKLMRIDPALPPDLETVSRLLSMRTAEDKKIVGKRYISGSSAYEAVAFDDMVWSPGKSVSVAHALASTADQAQIRQAHRDAVHSVMLKVDELVGWARTENNGVKSRERGATFWVSFEHTTSRKGDPQLHSHVAMINVVKSVESDRIGGLDRGQVYPKRVALRVHYHQELANNLQRAGFDAWYDPAKFEARIRNIPDDVLDAFSLRTKQSISRAKEYLAQKSIDFDSLPAYKQSAYISGAAAATREDLPRLKADPAEWRTRAENLGWSIPRSFLSPDLILLNTLRLTHEQAQKLNLTLDQQLARTDEVQRSRKRRELEHASRRVNQNRSLNLGRYHRGGEKMEWEEYRGPRLTL